MSDTTMDLAEARRTLVERRIRAAAELRNTTERIGPRDPDLGDLPASFAQQRLWFLDQWTPGRANYNVPYTIRIHGGLDVPALHDALSEVVRRHEVLRTTFTAAAGVPVQTIGGTGPLPLPVADLSALPAADREREAALRARSEAARPFDLAAGPLMRAQLLRLSNQEHLLLLTLHHIVSDAWSFRVLFDELNALYGAFAEDAPSPLAPLSLQYGDYAVWERRWTKSDAMVRHLDYWTGKLADAPVVEFPADRPRPQVLTGEGSRIRLTWDPDLAAETARYAKASGATLHMLLVAALAGLLERHNGTGDQVFGAAVAGRTRTETEELIGFFVNTLVLRIETGDDPTLGTLVQRARSVAIEAASHQDLPFDRIVEELRLPRELNRNPLFQIMLSTQNASHAPQAALHDLDVTVEPVDLDIAKFDLTFAFTEAADSIAVEVEFSTDLFDEPTVRLLVDRFERVLRTIVTRPGDRLSQVPVLSADETRHLVELSAPEPAPLPPEPVTAAFARWVCETPDRPAARFGDRTLTYAELDSWANRIAHRLAGRGIGRGSRVGLCTPRSVELVVGMLAIARTGAAYVPLDPANPAERLAFMAADAELQAVLHEESVAHVLPEGPYATVLLDDATDESTDPPESAIDPDDMLYIIYTSGSTGHPKGVCISHRAVMGLVWQADFVRLGPDDVLGQASNTSFDVATFEVWGALCNGALVVGVSKEVLLSGPALREHIATHGVTVMNVPSSLLSVLVAETPDVFAGLRTLLFGGEAADPAAVAAVLRRPPGRMLNVYGPSETTTFSVAGLTISVGEDDATVPLGRPVSHMWVYVMDAFGNLAPLGAEGELWIGGAGLARGYWGQPELTAERFVDDPFRPGERVYRSGDLGRWRADGTLEFCGRIDDQVKIRGYRIEPGEVAAVLTEHPGVREAVVIAHRDAGSPVRLIAYVVPSGPASVDEGGVRRFAVERLPEFMVPSAVVLLDRLPLNANDKVDRGALPVPALGSGGVAKQFTAPRSVTEEAVAGIWCEVLGCARAGIHDDFFALGGHSLLVTQVVSRLESRLGVRVPLRAVFESPVLEHLARVVDEHLVTVTGSAGREIVRVDRESGPLPVSFAQQRLWFLDRLVPGSAFYNMPDGYEVRGSLDIGALQDAVNAVVARHESLRTTFTEHDGVPWQVIHPHLPVPVHVLHAHGPEHVERITAAEVQRPFDLENGPLLRIVVIRTAADTAVLLLTMHHIVSDGWSSGVLLRELSAAYGAAVEGRQADFPKLPVQYADFAVWQRDWLRGEELERQRKYWLEALKDLPVLELPTDRPRPAVQSHRGAALEFTVDERTAAGLRRLAHDGRATLFMCLFSAFAAVLSRVSGQTDVALGYPVANRNHAHTEDLIGFFVNTLVLRADLSGDPAFTELVDRVRDVALSGYAHQDLPFEDLVEILRPERDLSRNPLVQTTFQLLNTIPDVEFVGGLDIRRLDTGSTVSQFDLSMDMVDEPGRLWGWINFSTDLFDTASIKRLISQFLRVLDAVAAQPEIRVSKLPLVDDAERTRLLEEFASETRPVEPMGAHQLFERQAAIRPDTTALVFGQDSWSFSELNTRANQLARRLVTRGIGPESRVALCAQRGPDLVTSILAVWKAGGAYVPIDPAYPQARLDFLLNDSAPHLLLTDRTQQQHLKAAAPDLPVLLLDAPDDGTDDNSNLDLPVAPTQLAYIIYTSGSTGTPKGVQIEHHSIANLTSALQRGFGVDAPPAAGAELRVAHLAPFSFDASVEQLSWLLGGHELHVIPDDIRRDPEALVAHIRAARLMVMDSTASQLELLFSLGLFAAHAWSPELVMVGGETISPALWAQMRATEGTRFFNLYGPTETTVDATIHPLDTADDRPAIGRPLDNAHLYVMDAFGNLAPLGAEGELWIGGAGLARGYWGQPELTAERFVDDPFRPGERVYRSGDLGRWRADGTLEFCGRIDDQVKIRGYRIEPGEVAAVLTEHPGVREAVVIAHRDAGSPVRLIAYVVPSGPASVDEGGVRRFAVERLPEFMVPSAVVLLDRLPLNANDKVDRGALPVPALGSGGVAKQFTAPRSVTEEAVAGIWCEVLGCARAGIHDDFFALGGHSLLVTQVVSRLESRLGVRVPLRAVFESPVLEHLARVVDEHLVTVTGSAGREIVRVDRESGPLPVSFAQQRLWFLDRLVPGSAFYNMPDGYEVRGSLDIGALQDAVNAVVARHESLRTTFTEHDGVPWQVIHPHLPVPVHVLHAQDDQRVQQLAVADSQEPFNVEQGPLLRITVVRRTADTAVLLLTMHHIVSDGWSSGVLLRELSAAYGAAVEGRQADFPKLPVQYADFAVWQRDWLRGEELERQRKYWLEALKDLPVLELPTDRPRPAVQSHRGAALEFTVDERTAAGLRRLAHDGRATLFMCLFSAFAAVLSRVSGQTDVALGYPVANRNHAHTEDLIGFFVNTLVLRADLSGDPAFTELVDRVRDVALSGYAHQDLPFEDLVEILRPERDLSRNPLVQTTFQLFNEANPAIALTGCEITPFGRGELTNRFDVAMDMVDEPGRLWGWINFSTDLFDTASIKRLISQFLRVLDAVAAQPEIRVSKLPLVDDAERTRLLEEFASETRPVEPMGAHQLFERQAAIRPDTTALVFGQDSWSFSELNTRANQLARRLVTRGIGPESRVALCAQRGPDLVTSILAVWKAGGAYVPIDPAYPQARLDFLLNDSAPHLLLTDRTQQQHLKAAAPDLPVLLLDAPDDGTDDNSNLDLPVAPTQLAYIIYTSGSTGTPKGVQIEHHSIANLYAADRPRPTNRDSGTPVRAAHMAPFSFDASVDQLSWLMLAGHELHLVPDETRRDTHALVDFVRDRHIDILSVTPSQLELLFSLGLFAAHAWSPELVMVGGETISPALWAQMRATKGTRFFNLYGPTETTVDATIHPLDTADDRPAIGRPIPNTRMYVMDAAGNLAPIGAEGELWIGGAGLARGYWARPKLTAERFVDDPFQPGERVYRSGDLGRWRSDGTLEFRGRIDDQVKIRGHRIEPGEIAAALTQHPDVREAAVITHQEGDLPPRLLAYVVPEDQRPTSDTKGAEDRDRVEKWRSVFQTTHAEPASHDSAFDISGWTSSYTGDELPAEEMQDWVEETVDRIRGLKPRRILEIGVGTGLLLWRLAPHCERYVGTDFSATTLAALSSRLRDHPVEGVELLLREGNDFSGFGAGEFDCVVINSVAQYFPHDTYLHEVLSAALGVLSPGGRIFVGDVRHLGLLDAFHHSVAEVRVGGGQRKRLYQQFLLQREREIELVLSPRWFEEFADEHGLASAAVSPKAGAYDNELTRFRYDVVLSTHEAMTAAEPAPALSWRDCKADPLTLEEARHLLTRDSRLLLSRVPNALVRGSARAASLLLGEDVSRAESAAFTVAELAALAADAGHPVAFSWKADHPEGAFDVAIGADVPLEAFPRSIGAPDAPLANTPGAQDHTSGLGPELKGYLARLLPEYLVPHAVMCVPELTLTVHGKLRADSLPLPDVTVGTTAPRTPLERQFAEIWSDVLRVTGVGVRDNFFDLGGNSLVATQVISRACRAGVHVTLKDLFQHQTIEELAASCDAMGHEEGLLT